MTRGFAIFALAAATLLPLGAAAQVYSGVRPVARSTDPAELAALATKREIIERLRMGSDEEAQGNWQAAGVQFTRVLALHPGEPQGSTTYYDLALAQAQLGDYTGATASLHAAIALDDTFLAARANLVDVDLLNDDPAAAKRDAADLLARAPASARALYMDGVVALRAGDADTALHDFGALLTHNPTYSTGHYDLALAQLQSNHLEEAERELRAALSSAPSFARARFALAMVLLREGRRTEARVAFDRAAQDAADIALRSVALSMRDSLQN
ncbi:MAG TPA: tetratricopeptide repeat protein [Candidatus Baltobacteraceae bacterium]